ncbi:carbohydrate esterase family 4 protein [Plicaturopsis crispa FD-325 SS-3]|nr:carbohydrate esterase family 4 protein [Plicaturopsis crispa FD-325 SS-3]
MKLQAFATLFSAIVAANAHNGKHARLAHKRQLGGLIPSASSSVASTSSFSPAALAVSSSSSAASSSVVSTSQTTSASASSASSTSAASSASASAGAASVSAPPPAATGVPPLSAITLGMPTGATQALSASFAPGATPSFSGAPGLPTAFVFDAHKWPAMDKIPDTSSSQVQQWMKELDGFHIPALNPTKDGTCANDTALAADGQNRGWWTCGGWTRPTDITACPDKYTWGMSFDDGPSPYTLTLLNYLSQKNLHATFFVVGSRVIERPQILINEYMTGHEISVHTWSHPHLTSLTTEQIVAELGWTRAAIKAVLGVTPTTFRPPYGDIDDRVRAIAMAMGLTPIIWTRTPSAGQFDTNDWKVAGGIVPGPESFASFQAILGNASLIDTGFIVLQHDLFEITVDLATGYTLNAALTHNPKLTLQPIGQCSKIPTTDLYLETNTNKTFPYTNHSTSTSGGSADGVSAAVDFSVPRATSLLAFGLAILGVALV